MYTKLFPSSKSVPPHVVRLVGGATHEALQDNNASTTRLSLAISKMDWAERQEAYQIRQAILNGPITAELYQRIKDFVDSILQPKPISLDQAA